jgi:hypothetical protein
MNPIAWSTKSFFATLVLAALLIIGGGMPESVGAAEPSASTPSATKPAARTGKTPVAKAAPVPEACTGKRGVERKICVECEGVPFFKRIGCQQRVFWTTCRGKRLFEDSYCQANQDQGPPRGEGN